ncbi:MAG: GNAT family protein [Clostridiaceae bacterium]|nr:GNAT family protein [Clostridiaceae bacterium]
MRYFKKLTGNTVYLSPMSPEDAETYIRWLNDPRTSDGLGSTGRGVFTVADERKWILEQAGPYQFAIVRLSDDVLLGNCGFNQIHQKNQNAEVGLFIGEETERSKGYGAEALELLLAYGFDELNLNNIMLKVFSFNARAIACYKKAGFREFGRRHQADFLRGAWQDDVYMEILRDEWRGQKSKA